MKRKLTKEEITEVLSLTDKDITKDLLESYFAVKFGQKQARFNTFDTFTLQKGEFYNKETIETTIGRYIFNMFVLPERYLSSFGYINIPLNKKAIGRLESTLGDMLLEDKITTKDFHQYLDRCEWIAFGMALYLNPTLNYEINIPIPEVEKEKDKLFAEKAEEIAAGNSDTANFIESKLLKIAKEKLKNTDNEAIDLFDSGALKDGYDNIYKKTSIMAGVIENPATKKLSILKSNYIEGISKEEAGKFGHLTIIGGYSRGVETQKSGYNSKKINNATQNIVLGPKDSDCGTTFYLEIKIPEEAGAELFYYRYILESGKLKLLTPENISSYKGKTVKMRSPMFCHDEAICNKCAGEMPYMIGIKNIGLVSSTLSGSTLNLALKKFHNSTIKFKKINIEDFIFKR